MAKLQITLDTDAKTLSVVLDGTEVPNVESVGIYHYDDPHFEVRQYEKVGDVRKQTTTFASENLASSAFAKLLEGRIAAPGCKPRGR